METDIGRLDPEWENPLPNLGPYNGQIGRRGLVEAVAAAIGVTTAVETGTYLGETAAAMAEKGLRVFTVEADGKRAEAATERFVGQPLVVVRQGDSRVFLRELLATPRCPLQGVLFYLDAHWQADLPLREEVEWIVRHWRRSVIVIDDFQVPDDDGYGYDRYPEIGLALTPAYLRGAAGGMLRWYWPARPSALERGARRGCVTLAWEPEIADVLDQVGALRRRDIVFVDGEPPGATPA